MKTSPPDTASIDPIVLQIHLYDFARDPAKAVRILNEDESFTSTLLRSLTVPAAEVFKR